MGTMEDQIRKIVREEIARALSAAGEVAGNADGYDTDHIESVALGSISRTMERVARDVLADTHPVLSTEHTTSTSTPACTCSCRACFTCTEQEHTDPLGHVASTDNHRCAQCERVERFGHWHRCPLNDRASTEPVHTITAVPERPRATCTCHRHTHVMGHDDRCGAPFCYCLSPVRARPEHTDVHASTEAPRTCTVCEHGEHDQGKCGMHVYLRGVASPCPCLASRTLGAQPRTRPNPMCTVCEHAPHGTGDCPGIVAAGTQFAAPCECGGIEA